METEGLKEDALFFRPVMEPSPKTGETEVSNTILSFIDGSLFLEALGRRIRGP